MISQSTMQKQGGMVMLEGLIAIVIFSFGVLAIVGMQAATARQAGDAKYRVDASFLVSQSLGMAWGNRQNLATLAVQDQPVSGLPNGKRTITVTPGLNGGSDVTVSVTWQLPGESKVHSHSSTTRING